MFPVMNPSSKLTSLSPYGQVFILLDIQHQLQAVAHPTLHRHKERSSILARVKGVALPIAGEYLENTNMGILLICGYNKMAGKMGAIWLHSQSNLRLRNNISVFGRMHLILVKRR